MHTLLCRSHRTGGYSCSVMPRQRIVPSFAIALVVPHSRRGEHCPIKVSCLVTILWIVNISRPHPHLRIAVAPSFFPSYGITVVVSEQHQQQHSNKKHKIISSSTFILTMLTAAQEENVATVGAQDSRMARKLQRELPPHIYAVAARNAKNRFFVPSKTNYFAGIRYDYVMIDNGCNSFLLPFNVECMTLFSGETYQWQISQSLGTGAVKSPTLIITIAGGGPPLGSMSLAGSGPLFQLTRLRFHLGTESARLLSSHAKLSDNGRTILTTFLSQMGNRVSPERNHVLLGQAYLNTVLSFQLGGIIMMGDATSFPTVFDYNRVARLVEPLREDFTEFDDLEDEDHDGDADEEYLQYEDIDEPVDEYME